MAQLKNVERALNAPIGARTRVGHNREIERADQHGYVGRLHGIPVAHIDANYKGTKVRVTLDHHGYTTPTTRSTMEDFLRAFGIRASVSFANKEFSVMYEVGEILTGESARGGHVISFITPRPASTTTPAATETTK